MNLPPYETLKTESPRATVSPVWMFTMAMEYTVSDVSIVPVSVS